MGDADPRRGDSGVLQNEDKRIKKRALASAVPGEDSPFKATDVTSADGAKIVKIRKRIIMSELNSYTTADYLPWSKAMYLIKALYENEDYRMSLLVGCGCFFGLKISDLLALTWEEILRKEELDLREKKTGKRRIILINHSFQSHIRKCHHALGVKDLSEPCFLNRYGGVISRQMVNRKLKWYKVKYQIPMGNFSTHTFRKTWARKIYEDELKEGRGEMALLKLSELMNQSSPAITRRYIGLRQEEKMRISGELI